MENTRKLAIPLTGVGRLSLVGGERVSLELGNTVAAWQNVEKATPMRVVIRLDGLLSKSSGTQFPCAVMRVDYTQAGLARSVFVDCVNQPSALVVWADSVEVTPVWDDRRIERLVDAYTPSEGQSLAAAISVGERGDFGNADARWLDAIKVDTDDNTLETSIHPIPFGARGVRFLNTLVSAANYSVPNAASFILWATEKDGTGLVQVNINSVSDTAVLIAPPVARYLLIQFPSGTIETFDATSWIEWIYAPNTLPGY